MSFILSMVIPFFPPAMGLTRVGFFVKTSLQAILILSLHFVAF